MAESSLSVMPALLGPSNLAHWSDVLRALLAYDGLEEHLERFLPPSMFLDKLEVDNQMGLDRLREEIRSFRSQPFQGGETCWAASIDWANKEHLVDVYLSGDHSPWQQGERKTVLYIKASVAKVRHKLISAGWKSESTSTLLRRCSSGSRSPGWKSAPIVRCGLPL